MALLGLSCVTSKVLCSQITLKLLWKKSADKKFSSASLKLEKPRNGSEMWKYDKIIEEVWVNLGILEGISIFFKELLYWNLKNFNHQKYYWKFKSVLKLIAESLLKYFHNLRGTFQTIFSKYFLKSQITNWTLLSNSKLSKTGKIS